MSSILTNPQPSQSEPMTQTSSEVSFMELLNEIQKTPREYWFHLFQILHAFREAIGLDHSAENEISDSEEEQLEQTQKNQAAIELLRQWREADDDQEQKETWAILAKALEVNE